MQTNSTLQENIFCSKEEARKLQNQYKLNRLMGSSIQQMINETDCYILNELEVPAHGEAGGYEHNKHKENFYFLDLAGTLYTITKEDKYKTFIQNLLSLYADKYLTFDYHLQKNTNPPGRLFHQILNEHMWLLYSSLSYLAIKDTLDLATKNHIINNLFSPMLEMFTVTYAHDFDRIHNHGLWAVAAVAFCGAAIEQPKYIDMAIYGLNGDSQTGGFLAQISQLFSASGYYVEGPYYHRFAIRPLCLLAELVHRYRPQLNIFEIKQKVIKKTIEALLMTAYPIGTFPALNDSSLTMAIDDIGVVIATSIYAHHYGINDNIIALAHIQKSVWVHPCGLALSEAYQTEENIKPLYWPSIILHEGDQNEKGGQAFLRMNSKNGDLSQLVMNYGQHGMGHGHFDTLGITLFNYGQVVLREYGFARWVNVEPKFGGRYLSENISYAKQSIAHNLVVVDMTSQNNSDPHLADLKHGIEHFYIQEPNFQAVSAFSTDAYPNVKMQRTVILLKDDLFETPLLIDLYRMESKEPHLYDYSFQYTGQIINHNIELKTEDKLMPLGTDNGYQHLWKIASAEIREKNSSTSLSWLQQHKYYTLSMATQAKDSLFFTRTGANDPSFNLRDESGFILRRQEQHTLFASVLETHGEFDESLELSTGVKGEIKTIETLVSNENESVLKIVTRTHIFHIRVNNKYPLTEKTTDAISIKKEAL